MLANHRADGQVGVQPFRAIWQGARLIHKPEFLAPSGRTLASEGSPPAQEIVRYAALVYQVELNSAGALTAGSMSTLERGHWRLFVDVADELAHL